MMQAKETMTEQEVLGKGEHKVVNYWEIVEVLELLQGKNLILHQLDTQESDLQELWTYKFKKFNFSAPAEGRGITFFENRKFKIDFVCAKKIKELIIENRVDSTVEITINTTLETFWLEVEPCFISKKKGKWNIKF